MITNYWIYLNVLPEKEKTKQIFILLLFFLILLAISGFLKFLKMKFTNKNKDSLFQKFLKML